jgi:hypothetical protein
MMESNENNAVRAASRSNGGTRSRYCRECHRDVYATNWMRHIRSRSHSESCRSSLGESARKSELFEPSVPLTDLRRCAAVVFGSAAVSYEALCTAARRLVPDVPLLVRQCMAVAAEMFAPSLRAIARDVPPREPPSDAFLRRPSCLRIATLPMRRCHSCPPRIRVPPVVIRATSHVTEVDELRNEPLSVVLSQETRPATPPVTGVWRRESPAAFGCLFTDLASLNASFNLDKEPLSVSAMDTRIEPSTPSLAAAERTPLSQEDVNASSLVQTNPHIHSTPALVMENLANRLDGNSENIAPVNNAPSREIDNCSDKVLQTDNRRGRGLEVSVSLTRIPLKSIKHALRPKRANEIPTTGNAVSAKRSSTSGPPSKSKRKRTKFAKNLRTLSGPLVSAKSPHTESVHAEVAMWRRRQQMAEAEEAKAAALAVSARLRELPVKMSNPLEENSGASPGDDLPTLDERIAEILGESPANKSSGLRQTSLKPTIPSLFDVDIPPPPPIRRLPPPPAPQPHAAFASPSTWMSDCCQRMPVRPFMPNATGYEPSWFRGPAQWIAGLGMPGTMMPGISSAITSYPYPRWYMDFLQTALSGADQSMSCNTRDDADPGLPESGASASSTTE